MAKPQAITLHAVSNEPERRTAAMAAPNHFPPLSAFQHHLQVHQAASGPLSTDEQLRIVVRLALEATPIDQAYYVRTYPDVARAVAEGLYASPREHFLNIGYFEGRKAWPSTVDAEWYLETYPDVAEGIAAGTLTDAQGHFDEFGFHEGRLPAAIG